MDPMHCGLTPQSGSLLPLSFYQGRKLDLGFRKLPHTLWRKLVCTTQKVPFGTWSLIPMLSKSVLNFRKSLHTFLPTNFQLVEPTMMKLITQVPFLVSSRNFTEYCLSEMYGKLH